MARELTWVAPDGLTLPLQYSQSDVFAGLDTQLAGTPPVRSTLDAVPFQSGSRWRYVDHGPRDVIIPIHIAGDTLVDLETAMDNLARVTNPTSADGRLRASRHDGTIRELFCRLVEAVPINEYTDRVEVWSGALRLLAADPYWYDTADSAAFISTGGGGATDIPGTSFDAPIEFDANTLPFDGVAPVLATTSGSGFFPFFPLRLGSSEALTDVVIENTGHVDAWPVFTITGPVSDVKVVNTSTGEQFTLIGNLGANKTLTIDTRPGRKVITDQAGTRVFPITGDSSLWPLTVGQNVITAQMGGSTAASSIVIRWRRRWLTA